MIWVRVSGRVALVVIAWGGSEWGALHGAVLMGVINTWPQVVPLQMGRMDEYGRCCGQHYLVG